MITTNSNNNDIIYGGIVSGYSTPLTGLNSALNGSGGADDLNGRRPKPVFFWSNGEVMKWLKRHCQEYYEMYGNVFLENEITGRSLIRINEQALLRMGIEDPEHRDQLARIIVKLKLKSDIIEIKDMEKKGLQQQQQDQLGPSSITSSISATNNSTSGGNRG